MAGRGGRDDGYPDYRDGLGLFAGIEMRFKRIVRPGETGRFECVFENSRRGVARARVTTVNGELAAEGVIVAVFQKR